MTTDPETTRIVRSWLEEGRTRLPDHVLDAVLVQVPSTPQDRSRWPARRIADVHAFARYAMAAAAGVVVLIVGLNVLGSPSPDGNTGASPAPIPSPSTVPSPDATPSAALRLPGMAASPGGRYGFEAEAGSQVGLHRVIELPTSRETTALIFKFSPDCLTGWSSIEYQAVPVRVAELEGVAVEPLDPPALFGRPKGDEITRAYELAVGDQTLCVFLTWHATTTADELAAAERVLDTLRAELIVRDRIRVTFTLGEGWDIG